MRSNDPTLADLDAALRQLAERFRTNKAPQEKTLANDNAPRRRSLG